MSETEMSKAARPSVQQVGLQQLRERLDNYAAAMAPGKPITSPEEGAQQQTVLWNTIRWVLSKKEGDFVALWAELLKFVSEHRQGVFNERHIYRFHDHLTRLSPTDRRNYERMLNLILGTCDPQTRSIALKQINMTSTLKQLEPEVQMRVADFYTA